MVKIRMPSYWVLSGFVAGISLLVGALRTTLAQNVTGSTGAGTQSSLFSPANGMPVALPQQFIFAQQQEMAVNLTACAANISVPMQNVGGSMLMSSMMGGSRAATLTGACASMGSVTLDSICPGSDLVSNDSGMGMTEGMGMMGGMGGMGMMGGYGMQGGMGMMGGGMGMMGGMCSLYASNPRYMMMQEGLIDLAMCSNQCKLSKLKAIQAELNCFSKMAEALNQEAQSLSTFYNDHIQKMQKQNRVYKQEIVSLNAMQGQLRGKLKGDQGSGKQGLLNRQQQLQEMLTNMPAETQKVNEAKQLFLQAKQSVADQTVIRKNGLTMECFSKRQSPGNRCTPNGPDVTFEELAVCRLKQNMMLGKNGVIERYASRTNQANASVNDFSTLMGQIFGDSAAGANNVQFPSSFDEYKTMIANNGGQTPNLLVQSVADIEDNYGAQLRQYTVGNQNLGDWVINVLKFCEGRADKMVKAEQNNANSWMQLANYQLRQQEQQVNQSIVELMDKYSKGYSDAKGELTGNAVPFDTSACTKAPLDTKMACLNSEQDKIRGLLNGTTPDSAVEIKVPCTRPTAPDEVACTSVDFQCKGINACVSQLTQVDTILTNQVVVVTNAKEAYAQSAYQSTENFTKQLAAMMSVKSSYLTKKLSTINGALLGMPGAGSINIPNKNTEALGKDADGIPTQPTDVVALLAGFMSPPLKDLSAAADANAGLKDAVTQTEQRQAALMQKSSMNHMMGPMCKQQEQDQKLEKLNTLSASVENCHMSEYCNSDRLAQTQRNLESVVNNLPDNASPALHDGISTFCDGEATTGQAKDVPKPKAKNCNAFYGSLMPYMKSTGPVSSGTSIFGGASTGRTQ